MISSIFMYMENMFLQGAQWAGQYSGYSRNLVYPILALSLVLLLIRKKREKAGGEPLEGRLYIANWSVFLIISLLEIFYVVTLGKETTWICNPYQVGWLLMIVNFLVFSLLVYNQLVCYYDVLRDVQYNSYAVFSWNVGLISWLATLLLFIILSFFYQPGLAIVVILSVAAQLFQIGIIFKNVVPKGGYGRALLCTVVYLFGSLATIALMAHFLMLLIIVLIGLIVVAFLGSFGGQSGSVGNNKKAVTRCPICGATYKSDGTPNCVCEARRRQEYTDSFEKYRW